MNSLKTVFAAGCVLALAACGAKSTVPSAGASSFVSSASACNSNAAAGANWVTFGFDQMHAACNQSDGGVTESNVTQLHKIWEYSQADQIFASPIVANGSVYVATLESDKVFALDATTGALEWSTSLETTGSSSGTQEIRQTPLYDDGMIFVGIHGFGPETASGLFPPVPSSMYALSAKTGKIVWSTQLQGIIRSSPAVVNGTLYVPVAGGDNPTCLQGGVDALNEQTGARTWSFYTDPTPNDGGSSWSPVAYDGSHLIFGTGNTCVKTPLTANAIVALNPADGSVAWELNTADQTSDDDVGAGVLLANGMAVTIGKNGVIYYLDEATGAMLHEVQTNAADGAGGYSTPATDGNTIVLGTSAAVAAGSTARVADAVNYFGRIRPQSTGTGGRLIALDMNGDVEWTLDTQYPVNSAVAISNGMIFADLDQDIKALDISTGQTLWSYAAPARILASPAVVSSGVYTADLDGNVYRFGP